VLHPLALEDEQIPSFAKLILDAYDKIVRISKLKLKPLPAELPKVDQVAETSNVVQNIWQVLLQSSHVLFHDIASQTTGFSSGLVSHRETAKWNPSISSSRNVPIITENDRMLLMSLASLQEWYYLLRNDLFTKYFTVTSGKLVPPPKYQNTIYANSRMVLQNTIDILDENPDLWPAVQATVQTKEWKDINPWSFWEEVKRAKETAGRTTSVILRQHQTIPGGKSTESAQQIIDRISTGALGIPFRKPIIVDTSALKLLDQEAKKLNKHALDILGVREKMENGAQTVSQVYDDLWAQFLFFSLEFPEKLRVLLMQLSENSASSTSLPYEKLKTIWKLNKRLQALFDEEAADFVKDTGRLSWML